MDKASVNSVVKSMKSIATSATLMVDAIDSHSEAVTKVAEAIESCFISPNVADSNLEAANIVDVIDKVACALYRIGDIMEKQGKQ